MAGERLRRTLVRTSDGAMACIVCATGTGVMGLDRRESAAIADCGLALGVGRLEMVGARLDAVAEVEPV